MSENHESPEIDPIFVARHEGDDELNKVIDIRSTHRRRPSVTPAAGAEQSKQGSRDAKKAQEIEKGKKRLAKLVADNALELPSGEAPAEAARKLLAKKWKKQGQHTLLRWNGDWYEWTGTYWACLGREALASKLWNVTADAYTVKVIDDEEIAVAWCPNRRKIAELMDAMGAQTYRSAPSLNGTWLDGRVTSERYVACKNGLVRLRDLKLIPHTPEFFNTFALDFDYDPEAQAPEWEKFLDSVWDEDPESRIALQQWFAYVLSGRMDLHKLLMIVGASRSGKGTIADVLRALLGDGNVSGPMLSEFEKNFGLADLIGKPLSITDDARLDKRGSGATVERLLTISGAGKLNVDRKNQDVWSGVLPCRLMILTNELPNLADSSGALMARTRILPMTRSFLGREDRTLGTKLAAEMAGILNWTLAGLELLEEYGDIIQPSTAEDMLKVQRKSGSPFGAFLEDCCNVGEKHFEVSKDDLRAAWGKWAEDNGYDNDFENDAAFGRKILSLVPSAKAVRRRVGGERVNYYMFIELDDSKADEVDEEENLDIDPFADIPGMLCQVALDADDVQLQKGDLAMRPLVNKYMQEMEQKYGSVMYPGSPNNLSKIGRKLGVTVPGGEMLPAFDRVFRARLLGKIG